MVVRPVDAVFGERLGGRARVEVYGAAVHGVVRRGEVYEVRLTPAGDTVGFAVADASLDSLGVGTPVVWRARAALAGDTVQLPALDRARLGAAL
ncbi:MAG: hypothetical protein NW201_09650, partial [Gemmatimonadales bacterium]|nr:hypothetical protein [Gemmatimonadales bacterium]